jgi:hypothetical protein
METTLMIIVAIIAALLIASFASGKEMNIERTVTIDKSLEQVFEFLKLTKNQDLFSVWNRTDPGMKKDYQGTDGTVGFVYRWDSATNKNVGAGEQEITSMEKNEMIEYEIRFLRPMQNVARSSFILKAISDTQTNVQWGFYSNTTFPMKLLKFIFAKMLGKDLEKSLQDLKVLLER